MDNINITINKNHKNNLHSKLLINQIYIVFPIEF